MKLIDVQRPMLVADDTKYPTQTEKIGRRRRINISLNSHCCQPEVDGIAGPQSWLRPWVREPRCAVASADKTFQAPVSG